MAVPQVIGAYVKVAGVWERANGNPAVDGTHMVLHKAAGVWSDVSIIYGKASSVWQVCHANLYNELSGNDRTGYDEAISGLSAIDYWVNPDGTFDAQHINTSPSTRQEVGVWRSYDCGRDYEVQFTESGYPWTSHPTTGVWLDMTNPTTTHNFSMQTTKFEKDGTMICVFRNKLSGAFPFKSTDLRAVVESFL